jgi:hypothetical protein
MIISESKRMWRHTRVRYYRQKIRCSVVLREKQKLPLKNAILVMRYCLLTRPRSSTITEVHYSRRREAKPIAIKHECRRIPAQSTYGGLKAGARLLP